MFCPFKSSEIKALHNTERLYTDKDNTDISWKYSRDIAEISEEWSIISKSSKDVFLQVPFLTAAQNNPPSEVEFFYFVFYYKNKIAGISIFQSKLFSAKDSIKQEEGEGFLRGKLRNFIAGKINFMALLNGNALLTGEHGFHFSYDLVSKKLVPTFISAANSFLKKEVFSGSRFGLINIVKDLDVSESLNSDWESDKYNKIQVQPNMLLPLRKEWNSFEDYLQAMSSKYRTKVKRGIKKSKGITKMELNAFQIETLNDKIYELYSSVKDNANFNLFELHPNYFLALKQEMAEDFKLIGYFKNDELVSFYTLIKNGHILDAHFLGYDKKVNKDCQLYYNMLIDMVKHGIENQYEVVEFARTAMEIKSTIGAEPRDLKIYIKHPNGFLNLLVSRVTKLINPKIDWEQRHPFKEF